ncbi:FeoA family protein [Ferviditalea candida]|uniref:FeoA family protein n=1 Tax=Ferviditalea candida TaxID=3108399 RepID=A0ABU5ZGQ9_9BACL|nr:FeoA family protein [Paenibacillaceae bacterium T2]
MLLSNCTTGDELRIIDLSGVNHLTRKRLHDLGVHEGMKIRCQTGMLFGGPLILWAEEQKIGIRRKDAAGIEVEPL